MNTQIRGATDSDIETLIALSRETISACYRSFLGDDAVDAFIASGAVDQYVRDNIEVCLVILADHEIVGYSVCKDNLIDLMMINHVLHRRGLGTCLLEHTQAMLFRSYRELTLESFEGNEKANRFYRKNGWTEVRSYFDGTSGVNKLVFTKTV